MLNNNEAFSIRCITN